MEFLFWVFVFPLILSALLCVICLMVTIVTGIQRDKETKLRGARIMQMYNHSTPSIQPQFCGEVAPSPVYVYNTYNTYNVVNTPQKAYGFPKTYCLPKQETEYSKTNDILYREYCDDEYSLSETLVSPPTAHLENIEDIEVEKVSDDADVIPCTDEILGGLELYEEQVSVEDAFEEHLAEFSEVIESF